MASESASSGANAGRRLTTSPCIGLCRLDPQTQLCAGCRRSIGEIVAWPDLSDSERQAILDRLRASSPAKPAAS